MGRENDRPLDWLIPQRSRVQELARELLEIVHKPKNEKTLRRDEDANDIAALLIGAAFSLWRAVFLAPNKPTSRGDIREKGSEFLDKFLRDNNISYGDEKNNREWSFGYYLNNVRFRLFHARKIRTGTDDWGSDYEWLRDPRGADRDINEEWNRHMKIFESEFEEFRKRFSS